MWGTKRNADLSSPTFGHSLKDPCLAERSENFVKRSSWGEKNDGRLLEVQIKGKFDEVEVYLVATWPINMKRFSTRQRIERLAQIWIERKCTRKLECERFADQKLRATKLCLCKSPHFQPHILQSPLANNQQCTRMSDAKKFSRPDIHPQHRSHHNSPVGERCEVILGKFCHKLSTLQRERDIYIHQHIPPIYGLYNGLF